MLELNDVTVGKAGLLYQTGKITIHSGELTLLFGANGAGKSTLLDAIALGSPVSGSIVLNGNTLGSQSPQERAKQVALVESGFNGASHLTTQAYLELGRFPHTGFLGRLNAHDHSVVQEIASHIGITHLLSQSTATLSDGERQRVSIARALIQETPLLLLDEPTSFLDYPNKRSILRLLRDIARTEQKIILLVSHDLELCLEYGDCFLLIDPKEQRLVSHRQLAVDEVIRIAFPDRFA